MTLVKMVRGTFVINIGTIATGFCSGEDLGSALDIIRRSGKLEPRRGI